MEKRLSTVAMRIALSAGFLSAVADRFGLWGPLGTPGVAWGGFPAFLGYTKTLLPFLPDSLVSVAGWSATAAEIVLAVALLIGCRVRWSALASGVLLVTFAVAMTTALGPEPPLSYSVWTAAAGAFLLAAQGTAPPEPISSD
ncbi:MauE/DoxX family redox-associated membrane protein [Singulisphaera sp. GP187]|uniref:MauE/DoxX family redox-associated membrane protein n=1 Tax=Singulisphaera sp. GP187 TaxID=1882752 RepID=UPI001C1F4DAF|nr:MauE/DoxX family redox-associated membrane protein [Singulisphaera sp. GP187]